MCIVIDRNCLIVRGLTARLFTAQNVGRDRSGLRLCP